MKKVSIRDSPIRETLAVVTMEETRGDLAVVTMEEAKENLVVVTTEEIKIMPSPTIT